MAVRAALERRHARSSTRAVRAFTRQELPLHQVAGISPMADVAPRPGVPRYTHSSENVLSSSLALVAAIEAIGEGPTAAPSPTRRSWARWLFIIDSYRYDPDLMKVICRRGRGRQFFGQTHLEINRAYELISRIVADGRNKHLPRGHRPGLRRHGLLRRDRAAPLRLDIR